MFDVKPDPKIFFWIAASDADVAAVNPNSINILLANSLTTFFIKGKQPVFSNVPKSLPKNYSDYSILFNWVFNNVILAEKPFQKALEILKTCVIVNKSLCGKLFSSL